MIGIYRITNKLNGKHYIRQAVNIKKRFKDHKSALKDNNHYNKHLQSSWNKYGEDNFIFDILEECEVEKLNDKEKYWIAYYESNNRKYGFNKTDGGSNGIPTEEAKRNMSKSHKGKKLSDEQKAKIGKAHKGMKRSDETKRKMSENNAMKNPEYRKKISIANTGKRHTEEQKQIWSKKRKGIKATNDMINDIKNNICAKDFVEKYNLSYNIFYRIKKEA